MWDLMTELLGSGGHCCGLCLAAGTECKNCMVSMLDTLLFLPSVRTTRLLGQNHSWCLLRMDSYPPQPS